MGLLVSPLSMHRQPLQAHEPARIQHKSNAKCKAPRNLVRERPPPEDDLQEEEADKHHMDEDRASETARAYSGC